MLTFLQNVLKNNKYGEVISLIKYYFKVYQTKDPFDINTMYAFMYVPTCLNLGSKLLYKLLVQLLWPLEQTGLAVKPC